MVLHPLTPGGEPPTGLSAWGAILRRQKLPASEWLLVTQSDHALLSGELAAQASHPALPALDATVVQAIGLHDTGWTTIDDLASPRSAKGRPLSFLEMPPQDTLLAWRGSIERAERLGPLAGVLVSEHFSRIAHDFAPAETTPAELAQALTTFVERERARQEDLLVGEAAGDRAISVLVDVLQFFDLLSLYLCCGAQEAIEFPQKFQGQTFRLQHQDGRFRMEPALFPKEIELSLKAGKYPPGSRPETIELRFTLA